MNERIVLVRTDDEEGGSPSAGVAAVDGAAAEVGDAGERHRVRVRVRVRGEGKQGDVGVRHVHLERALSLRRCRLASPQERGNSSSPGFAVLLVAPRRYFLSASLICGWDEDEGDGCE